MLGQPGQEGEGSLVGESVALHDNADGLPDRAARADSLLKVVDLVCVRDRYG